MQNNMVVCQTNKLTNELNTSDLGRCIEIILGSEEAMRNGANLVGGLLLMGEKRTGPMSVEYGWRDFRGPTTLSRRPSGMGVSWRLLAFVPKIRTGVEIGVEIARQLADELERSAGGDPDLRS